MLPRTFYQILHELFYCIFEQKPIRSSRNTRRFMVKKIFEIFKFHTSTAVPENQKKKNVEKDNRYIFRSFLFLKVRRKKPKYVKIG